MCRKSANEKYTWKDVNRFRKERGVTLTSAVLDEVPMSRKNIREVMPAQSDLVTVLGQFDPKLVKMTPAGERAEDWNFSQHAWPRAAEAICGEVRRQP